MRYTIHRAALVAALSLAACGDLSSFDTAPLTAPSPDAGVECVGCEARCNLPTQYVHVDDRGDGGVPPQVLAERVRVARLQVIARPIPALAHLAGAALCTVNYLGNSLVLTAAHCARIPTRAGMPAPMISPEEFVANLEAVPGVWRSSGAGGTLHQGTGRRVVAHVERNTTLDYMVLRIESPWEGATPVPLGPSNPRVGDTVCIVQHPGGREMVRACGAIKEVFATRVTHRCDTEPGSSGACVLASASNGAGAGAGAGACVALHVAGGCAPGNPATANRAILIQPLLAASPTLRALASNPVSTCPTGTTACDGSCVDLQTAPSHCGRCGNVCSGGPNTQASSCRAGACVSTCAPGWGDCDGTASNGCEVATLADPMHCGRCGNACSLPHASTSCSGGACRVGRCEAGWANCDTLDVNGCETRLAYDKHNCGACGRSCPADTLCFAGSCTSARVLCSGISPCGNGTACAAGMQCVTSDGVSRCICTGTPVSCATGEVVREAGPDTLCVPD